MENKNKERCFVITPIGGEGSPIRRHIEGIIDAVITPVLGDKYEVVVAHRIYSPGSITKQVIKEIYNSKLVIANLTDRNPNVMYELALRHAIGKPVIMIAEESTSLPADIISERTAFYINDAQGILDLKEKLKKIENSIKFEESSGPVYDALGDIREAERMIKSVGDSDGSAIEPLQHILDRLDKIENNFNQQRHSSSSKSSPYRESQAYHIYSTRIIFSFSEAPMDLDIVDLNNYLCLLNSQDYADSYLQVSDVHMITNNKIRLHIKSTLITPRSYLIKRTRDALEAYGFKDVTEINIKPE